MERITVLLADDNQIVRRGFREILEREGDLKVVGEAKNGLEAVALAKKFRPDLVLMDVAMPLLNGLKATCQILKAFPATKVLMLSMHSDEAYVVEAILCGAMGYLIKQTSADSVCGAIRKVQKGDMFFSPSIPRRLHKHLGACTSTSKNAGKKSSSERLNHRYPAMTESHRTILIIDDNPDVSLILKLILQARNFTVLEAENGEIGCDIAAAKRPSLILCDEQMPRLNGHQTLLRLKSMPATAAIPVLMIGGTGNFAEAAWKDYGASGFVPKPFQMQELVATVEALLSPQSGTLHQLQTLAMH